MAKYVEDRLTEIEAAVAFLRLEHDRTMPRGIEQRIVRLESFCQDFFTLMFNMQQRKVTESQAKIAKMKADFKKNDIKRSLAKRKPIKRRKTRARI